MTQSQRVRRRIALALWRAFNPVVRRLAGVAPWWVVLETTGRRTGKARQVPLACGPTDGSTVWLIAVHGEHASFARNISADPRVRVRIRGRWTAGTASVVPLDPDVLRRFNRYARLGPRTVGIDPKIVRVDLDGRAAGLRRHRS